MPNGPNSSTDLITWVFEGRSAQPYYVEQAGWSKTNESFTRTLFCVGVANGFEEPITVRVMVEEVVGAKNHLDQPITPERALQVFGATSGQSEVVVQPSGAPAFFEFVDAIDDSEWTAICYAEQINENSAGRHARIRLRAEGGGAITRATFGLKTHVAGGRRVPFTVERLT